MKLLSFNLTLFILCLTFLSCAQSSQVSDEISVAELKSELDGGTLGMLLDVRTASEIKQGTIPGVKSFADFRAGNFEQLLRQLDKSKTYYVYCHSGVRSHKTVELLKEIGFKDVVNVKGGIAAWRQNGYKTE